MCSSIILEKQINYSQTIILFPVNLRKVNKYIIIMYKYGFNNILSEIMKSKAYNRVL